MCLECRRVERQPTPKHCDRPGCDSITTNPRYCSRSCSATENNHRHPKRQPGIPNKGQRRSSNPPEVVSCLSNICEKTFPYKSNKRYCSSTCWADTQREELISGWLEGTVNPMKGKGGLSVTVRKWLLEEANYKCTRCGWSEVNPVTGKVPLQVDHEDGDYRNCSRDNLRVLCPNCHSLTPTFGNIGGNRKGRPRQYSKNRNDNDIE